MPPTSSTTSNKKTTASKKASSTSTVSNVRNPVPQLEQRFSDIKASSISVGSIESSRSQYSVGSKSACSIMAAEAALQLLSHEKSNIGLLDGRQFVDDILDTCAGINCDHVSFDELLCLVDRYASGLQRLSEGQIMLSDMVALEKFIRQNNSSMPFAVLLTKPPESIALVVLGLDRFAIFDSHKRSSTSGAYLVVFDALASALHHFAKIWPIVDSSAVTLENSWLYDEMINALDYTLVVRSDLNPEKLPPLINVSTTLKLNELSKTVDRQAKEIADLRKRLTWFEQQAHYGINGSPLSNRLSSPKAKTTLEPNRTSEFLDGKKSSTCCKCYEQFPYSDLYNIKSCRHNLCRRCVTLVDSYYFKLGRSQVPCFESNCRKPFQRTDIEAVLMADYLAKTASTQSSVSVEEVTTALPDAAGFFVCCCCQSRMTNEIVCFKIKHCDHKICWNCGPLFADEQILNSEAKTHHIKCPDLGCRNFFERSELEKVVATQQR